MLAFRAYQRESVEGWKQTRMLMFTMVKLWGDPKKPVLSPEDLMSLPGDDQGLDDQTETDALEILRQLREAEEKQNNGRVSQSTDRG